MSADPYTGAVEVGGPAAVRELPGLVVAKLAVGEMDNNAYLLRDTRQRRGAADRRGHRRRGAAAADRRRRPAHRRHLARALGPPPRPARGRRGHRGADRRAPRRRRRPAGAGRPGGASTATPSASAGTPSRSSTCAGTRPAASRCCGGRRRRPAPVHRRLPVPRRGRQHAEGPGELHQPDGRRRGAGVRRRCRTRRGSTPATGRTPPSARSGRTWRSGAPEAGEPTGPAGRSPPTPRCLLAKGPPDHRPVPRDPSRGVGLPEEPPRVPRCGPSRTGGDPRRLRVGRLTELGKPGSFRRRHPPVRGGRCQLSGGLIENRRGQTPAACCPEDGVVVQPDHWNGRACDHEDVSPHTRLVVDVDHRVRDHVLHPAHTRGELDELRTTLVLADHGLG